MKGNVPWFPGSNRKTQAKPAKQQVFTTEELAEKRRIAIEEERARKAAKQKEYRKKNEARFIELGRAICDLSPEDFGVFHADFADPCPPEQCSGEEVVANVANFVNNLKKLTGDWNSRGTILANTLALTGTICNVNQKSVVYIGQRVDKIKKHRAEIARKEQEARDKIDNHFIQVGRAVCALTPRDLEMDVSADANRPEFAQKSPSHTSECSFCEEDDEEPNGRSKQKLAWRGEDVVANVWHFSTALKDLLGPDAKTTVFRSAFEFTSMACNVAEKSVRDRHPIRKLGN
ncbi:unnamed protein product [Caenorhabditis sp. 36 PRJEB53466]|nr:unnamed protein product [Caenorhabditis sp. 36 PRJEB53466]